MSRYGSDVEMFTGSNVKMFIGSNVKMFTGSNVKIFFRETREKGKVGEGRWGWWGGGDFQDRELTPTANYG